MTTTDPIHTVSNQSEPLENDARYDDDRALVEAVAGEGAAWAGDELRAAGKAFARSDMLERARLANVYPPVLHTHDRQGRRIDEVGFHPAWHELLGDVIPRGVISLPWEDERPGAQVARAALFYLYAQTEAGTQCPLAMSFGVVPVLRRFGNDLPAIEELWLPGLLSRRHDPRTVPAAEKTGLLFGMGMTERQGGSDVRRNITVAEPLAKRGSGQRYRITGHKWFFSAPMCDAFLVLAQTDGGLSCLLVPRLRNDGRHNGLRLQRLKDKLGNRSNASSEVEFHDAEGWLLGAEGRGVPTIIEMATWTRLDCVLATVGMQRRALAEALHHAAQREAFGAALIDQPLMRAVLADLALEAEAGTRLAMFLAHCCEVTSSERDRQLARLLVPAAKFHVCKRGPQFAAEAIEIFGGNGYVEESDLPRIYRELPLLSIWEGSGNVMCLDVLRGIVREPETVDALWAWLGEHRGSHPAFDRYLERALSLVATAQEGGGRMVAHAITLAVQAALLLRDAPPAIAEGFCRTRLAADGDWGTSFGTLPADIETDEILERAAWRAPSPQ